MKVFKSRPNKKSWFYSHWFLGVSLALLVLIGVSLIKELSRSYQINKEIGQLQAEIVFLEGEQGGLADFVEYLKTDHYFEEQARIKLGLKAPGEKVVVLTDQAEDPVSLEPGNGTEYRLKTKKASNPAKWFNYFFGT